MNDVNPQPVDAAIVPRFGSIPTFMRLPYRPDPTGLDIGLVGVPWDGGTTNRAGARHGPREIRNMSSFMRKVHHVSRIAPYELARVADLGDAPVNPIDLMDALKRSLGQGGEATLQKRPRAANRNKPTPKPASRRKRVA